MTCHPAPQMSMFKQARIAFDVGGVDLFCPPIPTIGRRSKLWNLGVWGVEVVQGLNILSIYGISIIWTRFVSVCLVELNSTCHLALWKRGRALWVRRLGICDWENQSFATRNLAFLKLQLQCFDPWLQKILTKSVGSQGAREVRENRTEAFRAVCSKALLELCFQLFLCVFFLAATTATKKRHPVYHSDHVLINIQNCLKLWSSSLFHVSMFPCFQVLACPA